MKNKNFLIFCAFLFPLFLLSCEGQTKYDFRINNQSSSTLTSIAYNAGVDSTAIPANTQQTIYYYERLGGQGVAAKVSDIISDLLVINGQDTCVLDLLDDANWIIESEKTKALPASYNHTYKITLTDQDF